MAKNEQKKIVINDDAGTSYERARIAEAELMLKRMNRHYKPVPKFRGGCKNC